MTAMQTNWSALSITSTMASISIVLPSGQNGGGELWKKKDFFYAGLFYIFQV